MQLYFSQTSPYVRKVMVIAHETGQIDSIKKIPAAAHPIDRDPNIVAVNPSGKVPTAIGDGDQPLYDSRVICQYLDARHNGNKMYPADGPARWDVLCIEALADSLLDAAILVRYENHVRPESLRWQDWSKGQTAKMTAALATMEQRLGTFSGGVDAASIAVACALGYLDFRYADMDWRGTHPQLAAWFQEFGARPSMRATAPE